ASAAGMAAQRSSISVERVAARPVHPRTVRPRFMARAPCQPYPRPPYTGWRTIHITHSPQRRHAAGGRRSRLSRLGISHGWAVRRRRRRGEASLWITAAQEIGFSSQVPRSLSRHIRPFQDIALAGGGGEGAVPPMLAV